VAPSFSIVLLIRIVDNPDPLLNAKHLLIRAAPSSPNISEPDPALGYVMVTVDVEQASSVTTINPLGRVLTDALLALAACGDNDGRLMCYEKKTKRNRE
jgi:hypothetical protein